MAVTVKNNLPLMSKLTTKFQATIPLEIRKLLGLKSGDRIAFSIHGDDSITLRKATPMDIEFAK